jgi:hypothetical protein
MSALDVSVVAELARNPYVAESGVPPDHAVVAMMIIADGTWRLLRRRKL